MPLLDGLMDGFTVCLANRGGGHAVYAPEIPPRGPALENAPQIVLDQLRRAGFVPEWCSDSFIEAATQAAAIDCQVIDDPDGVNFLDELELNDREEDVNKGETGLLPYRLGAPHIHPDFRELVAASREKTRCRLVAGETDTAYCAA